MPFSPFPCFVLFWFSLLPTTSPFGLLLADLSDEWFPGGAVIRVPPDKCAEVRVRLVEPWSREITIDQLALTMDDLYPRFERATTAAGHILTIHTREPLGLLRRQEHRFSASAMSGAVPDTQWTILQWDKPYIESTFVSVKGTPLGIRIERPAGAVVLAGAGKDEIRFSGEVLGNAKCHLAISGHSLKPLARLPGFHFDERIPIASNAREVIVVATDDDGDSTALSLRVLPTGGN